MHAITKIKQKGKKKTWFHMSLKTESLRDARHSLHLSPLCSLIDYCCAEDRRFSSLKTGIIYKNMAIYTQNIDWISPFAWSGSRDVCEHKVCQVKSYFLQCYFYLFIHHPSVQKHWYLAIKILINRNLFIYFPREPNERVTAVSYKSDQTGK